MILFINTFLTESPFTNMSSVYRHKAKFSDKVEVFKYMLASLADYYEWTRVIINVRLDDCFADKRVDLLDFIHEKFDKYDLHLKEKRNQWQHEWIEDYELLNHDLIFFSCNHDHIFIDPDPTYFKELTSKFVNHNDLLGIQISHWQEALAAAFNSPYPVNNVKFNEDHLEYRVKNSHGIQLINKLTYEHWWIDNKLPENIPFPRPDGLGSNPLHDLPWCSEQKFIVPYREFGRHFDGYNHSMWYQYHNDLVPVVEVPDGFFENDFKINYSSKYIKGKYNINPSTDALKIYNDNGFECNISEQFFPHFWKDYITEYTNEMFYLSSVYSKDDLFNLQLSRILNMWRDVPYNNTTYADVGRAKARLWHEKLRNNYFKV